MGSHHFQQSPPQITPSKRVPPTGEVALERPPQKQSDSSAHVPVKNSPGADSPFNAQLVAFVAWIVPGLGHFLLGRWQRALAFSLVIATLLLLGLGMRGEIFPLRPEDPFGALGVLADLGSGSFYFLTRLVQSPGVNASFAIADYGTRMIAAAGLVNILAAVDAYALGSNRRR